MRRLLPFLLALMCLPATAGAAEPQVGAIRWNAWFPGNSAPPTHYVTAKLYSDPSISGGRYDIDWIRTTSEP